MKILNSFKLMGLSLVYLEKPETEINFRSGENKNFYIKYVDGVSNNEHSYSITELENIFK